MENQIPVCGVHIRVANIALQRNFYREVLQLGAPQVDSDFCVVFSVPGNGILILEYTGNAQPSRNGNVSWLYYTEDFEVTLAQLRSKGLKEHRPATELPGKITASFCDPEGNSFTIYSPLK